MLGYRFARNFNKITFKIYKKLNLRNFSTNQTNPNLSEILLFCGYAFGFGSDKLG